MNKIFPVLLLVVVGAGAWFFTGQTEEASPRASLKTEDATQNAGSLLGNKPQGGPLNQSDSSDSLEFDEDEDEEFYDDRPAREVYQSAEAALEAVKKGAVDYDDIVLEHFADVEDCEWCPGFFNTITELMLAKETDEDAKAYYSEILAITGTQENVETLITAIKESADQDSADIYAESLEIAVGDDNLVQFLSGELEGSSELLQESVVAALTNHGTRLAVDVLYEHTVASDDPDGFYSVGVGLGEVVPEEESFPRLQELVQKQDKYSHLAVKSLLNYGTEGLKIVFDMLEGSDNPEQVKSLLTDGVDHVVYEEETEKFIREYKEKANGDPTLLAFVQEIEEDFDLDEGDDSFSQ